MKINRRNLFEAVVVYGSGFGLALGGCGGDDNSDGKDAMAGAGGASGAGGTSGKGGTSGAGGMSGAGGDPGTGGTGTFPGWASPGPTCPT